MPTLKLHDGPSDGKRFTCLNCGALIEDSFPNAEAYSHAVLSYTFQCVTCDIDWWVKSNTYYKQIEKYLERKENNETL